MIASPSEKYDAPRVSISRNKSFIDPSGQVGWILATEVFFSCFSFCFCFCFVFYVFYMMPRQSRVFQLAVFLLGLIVICSDFQVLGLA